MSNQDLLYRYLFEEYEVRGELVQLDHTYRHVVEAQNYPVQVQKLLGEEVVISAANIDHRRGHGLGFLIIKDLVKTMGASLDIKSKKEVGTTVTVKLPGKPADGG